MPAKALHVPLVTHSRVYACFAALVVLAAGAAFWVPAIRRLGGAWPVPLDDVFIHFGFARSTALGHPFEWIPGNGYSSGGTSLTYPLALAPAYLLGLRGARLAPFAALVAVLGLVDLARSLRSLVAGAPRWVGWTFPALLVAVPLLDWTLFSGMEVALFGAVLGRTLVATRAAEAAPPHARAAAQLRAGLWAAALVATRPEAAPLALLLGVAVVHAARALDTAPSLARAVGPTLVLLAAQAAVNRALTGEWAAAGAVRKLIGTSPYLTHLEAAIEVIKNLAALRSQAFEAPLGGPSIALLLPLLGLCGALDRRARRLVAPLLLGAVATVLLTCLNATARFQNYRYAAPALVMLLAAAALGAASLARRGRLPSVAAVLVLLGILVGAAPGFPRQIELFARASANIAGQQVEVARRLTASPYRRVLVGDAGAIPYLSGLGAIDGLGLGGLRDLPFARASVHGVPAVVELIERLPAAERPDVLALYPGWWAGLADVFGRPIDRVRVEDNVICGADEKVIYAADWSTLAEPGETRPGTMDELDVADLLDERAHDYAFPGPRGGWVVGAVLDLADGRRRFDGGRIVPEGKRESFTIAGAATPLDGAAVLVMRTDGGADGLLRIEVERDGQGLSRTEVVLPPRAADRWYDVQVSLAHVRRGDRVSLFAARGTWRSFHVWLLREAPFAGTFSVH